MYGPKMCYNGLLIKGTGDTACAEGYSDPSLSLPEPEKKISLVPSLHLEDRRHPYYQRLREFRSAKLASTNHVNFY